DTRAWKALKSITRNAVYRIGLSATPINNNVADLAAELSVILGLDINVADAIVSDLWRPSRQNVLHVLMTRFSKDKLGIHFAQRQVEDVGVCFPDSYYDQVRDAVKNVTLRPKTESIFWDEITYFRLAASSARSFRKSTGTEISDSTEKIQ